MRRNNLTHRPAHARPLIVMLEEHYHAGEALRRMRRLTDGYALPPDASRSCRALFKGLEALEFDLYLHIHKENNVLFPRVFAAVEKLEAAGPAAQFQTKVAMDSAARS